MNASKNYRKYWYFRNVIEMTEVRNKHQNGQSFVELSLLGIVLIVLLAGVADFGRAYLISLEMRDAAQEGASYGAFSPT